MSEAPSTSFKRVISERHFFGKSLWLSTVCAAMAALLLVAIIFAAGGFAALLLRLADKNSPVWISNWIGNAVSSFNSTGTSLNALFAILVGSLCLRVALRAVAQKRIAAHVAVAVNRIREHIQRHAIRSNPGDLSGSQRATATNLFQTTAGQLQSYGRTWASLKLTTLVDLTVVALVALSIQWRVALECLIPVIVCWFIARIESERHEASSDLLKEQVERGLTRLTSDLDKARIVASYGMENLEHEQFRTHLAAFQKRSNTLRQQQTYGRWTSLLILIASIALPCFLLARHVLFGTLIAPTGAIMMMVCVGLTILFLRRLQRVPQLAGSATVAADEIHQFLQRVPPVSQVVGARFVEPMTRSLQFNQVSLETEQNPDLLLNLDLKIEAGQKVALLSLSAEANALVSLIPRFCDPTSGQVLIDGQDIKRATLESLRAEAIVVGGNEPVFSASVLENVTAGNSEISRQDAIEACKIAHAESFIRQLPKGYETPLGTDRVQLNAGQTFRLSLARAIARKPALLVVQEPSAALDSETKAMLDDTNQRISDGRTVLFLPTRLSTVKRCDRVVVLHGGCVAADGKHEDLVRSSDVYRHWEYHHFNAFRDEQD